MNSVTAKISRVGVSIAVAAVLVSSSAFAHVVVKPAEVVTAGFQTFTMGVPNEKGVAVTSIKLVIPDGMQYVSPTQKAGWQIDVEKTGEGEDAIVKSITWSASEIGAGFRDDFTFSGKVPAKATELDWKAYQTYADGSVVSWDKSGDAKEAEDSGPFSVTKVVADTEAETAVKKANSAATDAKNDAATALYVGIIGIVVGAVGIYLASQKKNK